MIRVETLHGLEHDLDVLFGQLVFAKGIKCFLELIEGLLYLTIH